jgi:hypothetical protein
MVCVEHGRDDERDWEEEGMWATSGEESEGIPVISRASKPSCGLALLRRGSVANLRSAPARVSSLRAGGRASVDSQWQVGAACSDFLAR